jgi:hypothetical protein
VCIEDYCSSPVCIRIGDRETQLWSATYIIIRYTYILCIFRAFIHFWVPYITSRMKIISFSENSRCFKSRCYQKIQIFCCHWPKIYRCCQYWDWDMIFFKGVRNSKKNILKSKQFQIWICNLKFKKKLLFILKKYIFSKFSKPF